MSRAQTDEERAREIARFEERIAERRELAAAEIDEELAASYERHARDAERRLRRLRRSKGEPIETPAGIVSEGSRIRVDPRALLEPAGAPIEVKILEIWPSGRMRTDRAIKGTPLGDMPIMVDPEDVVEVVGEESSR